MALQEEFESQGNFLFRYRSTLPIVLVAAGIWVFVFNRLSINYEALVNYSLLEYISLVVSFFGFAIRIYAVGHTPAKTSGRNTKVGQLAEELNTTGIYSIIRHPLYFGNFFMWLAVALLCEQAWFVGFFILAYWFYYERIMYAEEQFLRRKFGAVYTEWAAVTPAFIPSLHQFVKPKYSFSIKKVLKKEKNGLLAIFFLLFMFHNIGYSIEQKEVAVNCNWICYATIASGIIYLILKGLKRTSILNQEGR
ncbi:MAG: methyltransferase family protein [Paludibacter sp.]